MDKSRANTTARKKTKNNVISIQAGSTGKQIS